MTEQDPMGTLRSMLNAAYPDAAKVLDLLRQWPLDHERERAEHYAWDHFKQLRNKPDAREYTPRGDMRMRYDPRSRVLSRMDGLRLKEMCCPLEKRWEELEVVDVQDRARACAACQRHVFDTRDLTAEDVQLLVARDPDICLHVSPEQDNVSFVTSPPLQPLLPAEPIIISEPEPAPSGIRGLLHSLTRGFRRAPSTVNVPVPVLPTITTAHTFHEINYAAALGYWPLLKQLTVQRGLTFLQVWQHARTGEIAVQADGRFVPMPPPWTEWRVALPGMLCDPNAHDPFAAYLLPPGLTPDTQVILETVLPTNYYFDTPDSDGGLARWTGGDLEIERVYTNRPYPVVG